MESLSNTADVSVLSYSPLVWPTSSTSINSYYGPRTHPITGLPDFHNGIDIGKNTNSDPVWSSAQGTVIYSANTSDTVYKDYGNLVAINSSIDGMVIQTRYAHLASRSVSSGTSVSAYSNIGVMGTTGSSSGIHLHYETRIANSMSSGLSSSQSYSVDPMQTYYSNMSYSIDNLIVSASYKDPVKIMTSEFGEYGISKGPIFISLEYILFNPNEKIEKLGITSDDIQLLVLDLKDKGNIDNIRLVKEKFEL